MTKATLNARYELVSDECTDLLKDVSDATVRTFSTVQAAIARLDNLITKYDAVEKDALDYNASCTDPADEINLKKWSQDFRNKEKTIRGKYFFLKDEKAAADAAKQSGNTPGSQTSSTTATPVSKASVKLPRINIKTFSGEQKDWIEFYSVFTTLIDQNPDLSLIQKFSYLKTSLQGKALDVIASFQFEGASYQLALDKLKERYHNTRVQANYYLSQLMRYNESEQKFSYSAFLNKFSNAIAGFKETKLNDHLDFLLFYLVYQNLPAKDKQRFDIDLKKQEPTLKLLLEFLETYAKSELNLKSTSDVVNNNDKSNQKKSHSRTLVTQQQSLKCLFCAAEHKIYYCAAFLKLDTEEKFKWVKDNGLCTNCLGSNHKLSKCNSSHLCKKCNKKHSTLLHKDADKDKSVNNNDDKSNSKLVDKSELPPESENRSKVCCATVPKSLSGLSGEGSILLSTASVLAKSHDGKIYRLKAVVDPCSEISLISSSCLKMLGLKSNGVPSIISGVGNQPASTKGEITLKLYRDNPGSLPNVYSFDVKCRVVDCVTDKVPSSKLPYKIFKDVAHLDLADKTFHVPSEVDILLDGGVYARLLTAPTSGPIFVYGEPSRIYSHLGWLIFGRVANVFSDSVPRTMLIKNPLKELRDFWEWEPEGPEESGLPPIPNPDDVYCENFYKDTTYRDESGRYVVSMPLKPNVSDLKNNESICLKMYLNQERRLENNEVAKDQYNKFLNEYLSLGHMELASSGKFGTNTYFLPHHAVYKKAPGSKIRVVFDGSFKRGGVSLNECMHVGPKLQANIADLLFNFRLKAVALCCDVEKMYRNILLSPDQRRLQHILWRPSEAESIKEFELKTVTYGLTASPWLSLRTMQQLAEDVIEKYPLASEAIKSGFYIDDLCYSVDNLDLALKLKEELILAFQSAGFTLKKWHSSHPEILSDLDSDSIEKPISFVAGVADTIKILGLQWDSANDNFLYFAQAFSGTVTKRSVLSYIAKIFDPNGYVSPVVFKTKLFVQKLWLEKAGWDDPLPLSLVDEWSKLTSTFSVLSQIRIPRFVCPSPVVRLVGFCDASNAGYACAVYVQGRDSTGKYFSHLVRSKTKIAGLTPKTIPLLELNGALLLAKTVRSIVSSSKINFCEVVLFCDSQIVLARLKKPPHVFKTPVAHRVYKIQKLTSTYSWFYISTKLNSADLCSRGTSPRELLDNDQWFHGPPFLLAPREEWPLEDVKEVPAELLDLKKPRVLVTVDPRPVIYAFILRFSDYFRLVRVMAYFVRWFNNLKAWKTKDNRITGPLNFEDLRKSEVFIFKHCQKEYFAAEVEHCAQKSPHTNKCQLIALDPFVDDDGLLRVGGRLENAEISYARKHPIILSDKCPFTRLLVEHYHKLYFHAGTTILKAILKQRFWITSLHRVVKACVMKCLTCEKFFKATHQPKMANLPFYRVNYSRPFSHVGVDFAGPFMMKSSHLRKAPQLKGYFCLFICFCVKAVHIEFCSELSTEAYLACLHRFVSRRGLPNAIYSDQGKNFVGAANQLNEVQKFLEKNSEEIQSIAAKYSIKWVFNPAYSPNFGGLWERAIRTAKSLLYKSIGDKILTFEEYATLVARIEAIMNSRPLTPLADESDNVDFLTPAHFLIGSSLFAVPEEPVTPNMALKSRWKLLSHITQNFWKRWHSEYLNTLTKRSKWGIPTFEPKVGQLVYLTHLTPSPLHYALGLIIKLHPGSDNVTRVVSVKTSDGKIHIRPVNKLILLSVFATD